MIIHLVGLLFSLLFPITFIAVLLAKASRARVLLGDVLSFPAFFLSRARLIYL